MAIPKLPKTGTEVKLKHQQQEEYLQKAIEQMMTLPPGEMYTPQNDLKVRWMKSTEREIRDRHELDGLRFERIIHERCDYRRGHKIGLVFRDERTGREWYQAFHLDHIHSDLRGVAQMLMVLARKLEAEWEKAMKKARKPLTPSEKRELKEREAYGDQGHSHSYTREPNSTKVERMYTPKM